MWFTISRSRSWRKANLSVMASYNDSYLNVPNRVERKVEKREIYIEMDRGEKEGEKREIRKRRRGISREKERTLNAEQWSERDGGYIIGVGACPLAQCIAA